MSRPSPTVTVMMDAARAAGRRLIRDFGEVENLQVSRKGPSDFVSNADKKAEEIIRKSLEKTRPGYGFLLEEGGEVQGVLVGRCGDDRVHFAGEGETGRGLDRVPRDAAGPERAAPVAAVAAALTPGAHRHPPVGRERRDLVLGADQGHLGVERSRQRGGGDLGPDAAGVAEGDGQPRAAHILISTYVARRRWSRYRRIASSWLSCWRMWSFTSS